jgi:PAS domain S-box-containing protein
MTPDDTAAQRAELLRISLAVDSAQVGSFDWDLRTGRLVWDDRLRGLFGYTREDFGETIAAFDARVHPDDRERVGQALQAAIAVCEEFEAEYRVVLPSGEVRWVQARGQALPDADGVAGRLIGAAFDTTDLRDGAARTARVLEAMPSGFFSVDREWSFSFLNAAAERLLGRTRDQLLGRSVWAEFPDAVGTAFEDVYRSAVDSGRPQTFEAYYPAPLDAWYEVLAWPTPDGLSVYFSDITARKAAAAAQERTSARLALTARVTAHLAEAADTLTAVADLPRLMVPGLAEGVVLTVVDADGRPRDVGSWHTHPQQRAVLAAYSAGRLEQLPLTSPLARVLAGSPPVRSNGTEVAASLPDGRTRDLLRALDAERGLVLPVPGRDRVLGALTLFSGAGQPPDEDVEETARDLASRIGLALDNARLAAAQGAIAEGLQRSLLTDPPEPDHAHVVARYVPASEAARVGGDWYDAFMQPGGSTMLVIGDVVGHDIEAAAAMGQLRGLLRGIATYSDAGPAEVLRGLDSSMRLLRARTMATAVVARLEQTAEEFDRGVTRMLWANAGHPAPLVVHPDGTQTVLASRRGELLLGVDDTTPRTQRVITLDEGSTVLLYSDGLVERRDQHLDEGLERLQQAVAELHGSTLDQLCDGLVDRLVDGHPDDDVALVAVRLFRQDQPRPPEAGPNVVPPGVPPALSRRDD